MNKTRRIIVLTILMCLVDTIVFAYDFEANGIFYTITSIDEKTVEVTFSKELNYQQRKVVIPSEVDWNGYHFYVKGISAWTFCKANYPNKVDSLIISHGVEYIGDYAFQKANFSMISIPNTIVSIGREIFVNNNRNVTDFYVEDYNWLCSSGFFNSWIAKDIYVNNIKLTEDLVIPNGVKYISRGNFAGLNWIKTLKISGSVEYIDAGAFGECANLEKVEIEEGVKELYGEGGKGGSSWYATGTFAKCYKLETVILPSSISLLGDGCFSDSPNLKEISSYITDPFAINSCFSNGHYLSTTLKIPMGTIGKYQITEGWKKFVNIDECLTPRSPIEPNNEKCATPTISYHNGKLTFNSDTEGAICHSTVSNDDIKSYDSNEIQLGVTYNISVYATKEGYQNSETVTATLCWIDVEPKTEGITNGIAQMAARAIMVKAEGGQLTVEGAEDNTNISVYTIDGVHVGTSTSRNGVALINTSIPKSSVTIVKIGNKSVKVMMK